MPLTEEDWEKSEGEVCLFCGETDVWIRDDRCRVCYRAKQQAAYRKWERRLFLRNWKRRIRGR